MKSDKENRRKALKAIAIGAPVAWAKPVVDSVVLPTHAQSTCTLCELDRNCYMLESSIYTSWPGGSGPYVCMVGANHNESDCSDQNSNVWNTLVIAESEEQAQCAFDSIVGLSYDSIAETGIQPPELNLGCNMYFALGAPRCR